MRHYLNKLLKEQELLAFRKSQSDKIVKKYKYGMLFVLIIGFVLQSTVCLVGEMLGQVHYQAWITFLLAAIVVFITIYIWRFGIIRAITSYMAMNILVMVVTYKLDWNVVTELGFMAEMATSFLGLIAAYFLGLKHYIEDSDW